MAVKTLQVHGKAVRVLFTGFSYFGNYTQRNDGPGKVFDVQNVSGITGSTGNDAQNIRNTTTTFTVDVS